MRNALIILFVATFACFAGEKAHFYGTWEPRPALRDFWRPLNDSWWEVGGPNKRLAKYGREYAKHTTPEALMPEMIADLKQYPSEVHWFVYMMVASHWPREQTLKILDRFEKSSDPDVQHIASDFIADLE